MKLTVVYGIGEGLSPLVDLVEECSSKSPNRKGVCRAVGGNESADAPPVVVALTPAVLATP